MRVMGGRIQSKHVMYIDENAIMNPSFCTNISFQNYLKGFFFLEPRQCGDTTKACGPSEAAALNTWK